MDDADRLRFAPRVQNPGADERKPYRGNKNPSRHELAGQGYETLVVADPASPYSSEDRPTTYEDTEYDPMMVRRF